MTFAEFILLVGVVIGLYFLMRPLQAKLEHYFIRLFRSRTVKKGEKPIIDIKDYKKKS